MNDNHVGATSECERTCCDQGENHIERILYLHFNCATRVVSEWAKTADGCAANLEDCRPSPARMG